MAAAEKTFLGFAKQSAFETPNTTDNDFKYMLFTRSAGGPNPIQIPLPPEVGGGALLRNILKVGVNSGVQGEFIPRPEVLGFILHGMTGNVTSVANFDADGVHAAITLTGSPQDITTAITNPNDGAILRLLSAGGATGNVEITGTTDEVGVADTEIVALVSNQAALTTKHFSAITEISVPAGSGTVTVGWLDGSYSHTFTLGSDQFDAPWYTARWAPASMWGEQLADCRFNLVTLNFRSPDFIRGAFAILGREPTPIEDISAWSPLAKVDGGPQFITPVSAIELPLGTNARALNGSLTMMSNIPLDQQYIVGQYFPEGLDIVSRGFALQIGIKVDDYELYGKMMYDPDETMAWVAKVFKEGDIKMYFASTEDAAAIRASGASGTVRPYSLNITANGQSGDAANVVWTATPPEAIAQRQLVMQVTGTFLASPDGGTPISITLVNRRASY